MGCNFDAASRLFIKSAWQMRKWIWGLLGIYQSQKPRDHLGRIYMDKLDEHPCGTFNGAQGFWLTSISNWRTVPTQWSVTYLRQARDWNMAHWKVTFPRSCWEKRWGPLVPLPSSASSPNKPTLDPVPSCEGFLRHPDFLSDVLVFDLRWWNPINTIPTTFQAWHFSSFQKGPQLQSCQLPSRI